MTNYESKSSWKHSIQIRQLNGEIVRCVCTVWKKVKFISPEKSFVKTVELTFAVLYYLLISRWFHAIFLRMWPPFCHKNCVKSSFSQKNFTVLSKLIWRKKYLWLMYLINLFYFRSPLKNSQNGMSFLSFVYAVINYK